MKSKINSSAVGVMQNKLSRQTVRTQLKKAIGYIRVSTMRQHDGGISLNSQAELLRNFAKQKSLDLVGICEDAHSAYGRRSSSRPSLLEAIAQAQSDGIPILVTSIDRLSRNPADLELFKSADVKIISVKEGRISKGQLKILVHAAEAQSVESAQRSQASAARSRVAGRRAGNKTNLSDAQRKGAIANMGRSQQKVRDLASYIAKIPALKNLSWPARVEMLNSAGHHNLVSGVYSDKKRWTVESLRKPFNAALAEIEFEDELDQEDAALVLAAAAENEKTVLQPHVESAAHIALEAVAGERDVAPVIKECPESPSPSMGPFGSPPASILGGADVAEPKLSAQPPARSKLDPDDYPVPLRRRGLNDTELALLRRIMQVRGLSESQVMDELGKSRLDASLWQSRRNCTTVTPDMLGGLLRWFGENRSVWRP